MKSLKERQFLEVFSKKHELLPGQITTWKVVALKDFGNVFSTGPLETKELISCAGLDVVENQSGKHKGKTWISKKGNADLRAALYMPALSAIRYNEKMRSFNERTMQTHSYKKQGIAAVMRKLLILIYQR